MIKYPRSLEEKPAPEKKPGFWRSIGRHWPGFSIVLALSLVVATLLYPYMVVTVPSGDVGVLWKRLTGPGIYCWCILARGTILDPRELREEGLHIIWPWDKLFLYDLRLQSDTETYNAISSDGVNVTAEINIRYQLNHDSVAVFHKFIGPGYLKSLLAPEIGSQARDVISRYTAQNVYVSRQEIGKQIKLEAQKSLGEHLNQLVQPEASEQQNAETYRNDLQNSIRVLDTLVLSIELPASIVAAINSQTEQQYKITEYKYRAEREVEESKRKQIEANGIAAFQRTVSEGISDSYLRWQGIAATVALAESPNAKVVVIGAVKDGLPVILGNMDSSVSPVPAPQPGTGGTTPPSGTSPSSSGTTPSGSSSTAPTGTPADSPKPPSMPGGPTPAATIKKPTADSSPTSTNPDNGLSSSTHFALSDIKSMLSRLSDVMRSSESPTSAGTATKP
jgi:regulator of protease activity HflC (stomatin/prohibitin superfamily)